MQEGFEGTFPSAGWDIFELRAGDYQWAKRNCKAFTGGNSGWAMGGGSLGSGLGCGANYIDNAFSLMIYGSFSLAAANEADLSLREWVNTVAGADQTCWMASTDDSIFNGWCRFDSTSSLFEAQSLDLANVPFLGNTLGQSDVWIAVFFLSDGSGVLPNGAFVDDLLLRKCLAAACSSPSSPSQPARTGGLVPYSVTIDSGGAARP